MLKKRDYIDEIVSRRNRLLRRTGRWSQVNRRLQPLIYGFDELKKLKTIDIAIKKELFKYIPIRGVACVEGWYRMAVAEMIDKGPPFRENAKSHFETKINASILFDIHDKKVTIGQFIAHFLPANRFEDITKTLSVISGEDFLERFKYTRINPENKPNPVTFQVEAPQIFQSMKETFKLRHILCHELATSIKLSIKDIESCIYGFLFFLIGGDRVVEDLLVG